MSLAQDTETIFLETLKKISPQSLVENSVFLEDSGEILTICGQSYRLENYSGVYIIGFGKASYAMASAIVSILGDKIDDGIIISPARHKEQLEKIQEFKGTHPVPDKESLSSALEVLNFAEKLPGHSLVVNLVSGGTSALFSLPEKPLEIEEMAEMHQLLIKSGAAIQEINTVRIALSSVKGGKFLQHLENQTVIDLVFSDVPGDELKYIGSGPTIPQKISYGEVFRVLKNHGLWEKTPHAVRTLLGQMLDLELKQEKSFETYDIADHASYIIASSRMMAETAARICESLGYETNTAADVWTGDISELDKLICDDLKNAPKKSKNSKKGHAYIYYGECTVQVTGNGLGGRNQELALRMAGCLDQSDRKAAFLSAGSDGIDGPTDAAGAIVTNQTLKKAREKGIDPKDYLDRNDSYHFFEKAGGHLKPGPTGNNLMDLQVLLVAF